MVNWGHYPEIGTPVLHRPTNTKWTVVKVIENGHLLVQDTLGKEKMLYARVGQDDKFWWHVGTLVSRKHQDDWSVEGWT